MDSSFRQASSPHARMDAEGDGTLPPETCTAPGSVDADAADAAVKGAVATAEAALKSADKGLAGRPSKTING